MDKYTQSTTIRYARKAIEEAEAIIITAGAGMGVDSGLPDFRGNEGFWKAYPPIAKLGYDFTQMANATLFSWNPKLAWGFYGHRLNLYRETIPHEGFKILLDLVKKKNDNYFIYTSNVDGQFQKAGFDEEKICEVHGSIHHLQCAVSCTQEVWTNNLGKIQIDMELLETEILPKCKNCEQISRPNIMMFGDYDFIGKRTDTQAQRFRLWQKQNKDKKKVIIEIGAGSAIPTIREYGDRASRSTMKTLIRINPREPEAKSFNALGLSLTGLEGIKKICLDDQQTI